MTKGRARSLAAILLTVAAVAGCLDASPDEVVEGPDTLPEDERPCIDHHITMKYEGESLDRERLSEAFREEEGWGYQETETGARITPEAEGVWVTAYFEQDEPVRTLVVEVEEGVDPTAHHDRVDAVARYAAEQLNMTFPDARLTLWTIDDVEVC